MTGHKSSKQNSFYQAKTSWMTEILRNGLTYIIGNTQVYDSVVADVMKKIATQKDK